LWKVSEITCLYQIYEERSKIFLIEINVNSLPETFIHPKPVYKAITRRLCGSTTVFRIHVKRPVPFETGLDDPGKY
jgi:hypothetical protein